MKIAEKPFEYLSHNGTRFRSSRCDFRGGVTVIRPKIGCNECNYVQDIAEMMAYHQSNILPELNGFQGYDCVKSTAKGATR